MISNNFARTTHLTLSQRLLCCTALALVLAAPAAPAFAQNATPAAGDDEVPLPALNVDADKLQNPQKGETSIGRMRGTIQDTPKEITVIPQEVLRQQNSATLEDALRNAPGITMMVGEGGQPSGDNLRIRGFDSRGDMYVDGLRDFGNYTRDAFNYEQVEVLKGPSGQVMGRGSAGGAVQTVSKVPTLDAFGVLAGTGGNGPYWRGTFDVNQPLGDGVGLRINGMLHDSETVDRDLVESKRWGIAPTIAFGIGTDTTFSLGYFHMTDNRIPDYGIPFIPNSVTGTTTRPVTEVISVDRSNFYGFRDDHDDSQVDTLTGRFSHKFSDSFTIQNDTRIGYYTRDFQASAASCTNTGGNNCLTLLYDGNPATVPLVNRTGPAPYYLQTWGAQNVTTLLFDFEAFSFRHEATAGMDYTHEDSERTPYAFLSPRDRTSLFDPSHDDPTGYVVGTPTTGNVFQAAEADTLAFFATDRVWFTPQWSILAGMRWDRFISSAEIITATPPAPGVPTQFDNNHNFISPSVSVIFEPMDDETFYVSWGRSARPTATIIAQAPNAIAATTNSLEPEKVESYEAGAKFSLLNDRLGISTSIFQIEKDNAVQVDPLGGGVDISGDAQKVRGFEIGVGGRLADNWTVNASYTYLHGRTIDATLAGTTTPNTAVIGKELQNIPDNAASLWTVYEPVEGLELGGGLTYRDMVWANTTNTAEVPYFLSFDSLIAYELGPVRFQLNGYNLADATNYTGVWANRATPQAGRSFLFTTSVAF